MSLLLAGCSARPLTETEAAFLDTIHGPQLTQGAVRLVNGAPTRAVTFRRPARPRVTCRENILPPPTTDIVTGKPAAVALFNRVLFDKDWYVENYLPAYPDQINLIAAMLLAHEITHVWQWQNREITGYHPLKAVSEHRADDPYLFDLIASPEFLDLGYEQQGAVVEEYVCCRALDPRGARTARLHGMIGAVLPLTPLPARREHDVLLPWSGAKPEGICS